MAWYELIDWQWFIYALLIVVANLFGSRSTNSKFKEVIKMLLYRTPDYRQAEDAEAQSFDRYKKQYELDNRTDTLVAKEQKLDVQALVDSKRESCLDKSLQRLMPDVAEQSDMIADYTDTRDDLDMLADAFEVAEAWRDRLGLGDDVSVGDVFEKIKTYEHELKERLKEANDNAKKTPQKDDPQGV